MLRSLRLRFQTRFSLTRIDLRNTQRYTDRRNLNHRHRIATRRERLIRTIGRTAGIGPYESVVIDRSRKKTVDRQLNRLCARQRTHISVDRRPYRTIGCARPIFKMVSRIPPLRINRTQQRHRTFRHTIRTTRNHNRGWHRSRRKRLIGTRDSTHRVINHNRKKWYVTPGRQTSHFLGPLALSDRPERTGRVPVQLNRRHWSCHTRSGSSSATGPSR